MTLPRRALSRASCICSLPSIALRSSLCRTAREGHHRRLTRVPAAFDRSRPVQDPHRPHNGIQFTTPGAGGSAVPLIKEAIANRERFRAHAFECTCATNDIEHRTTTGIRTPLSSASTTRNTTNSASISPTSLPPTTSAAGSRHSRASPHTNSHLQGMGVAARTLHP